MLSKTRLLLTWAMKPQGTWTFCIRSHFYSGGNVIRLLQGSDVYPLGERLWHKDWRMDFQGLLQNTRLTYMRSHPKDWMESWLLVTVDRLVAWRKVLVFKQLPAICQKTIRNTPRNTKYKNKYKTEKTSCLHTSTDLFKGFTHCLKQIACV